MLSAINYDDLRTRLRFPKGYEIEDQRDFLLSKNQRMEINAYKQIGQSTENSVCVEMDLLQVGSEPVGMRCPYCQEDMMTMATYRNTPFTHLIALVLGILFWWLCCCIIPYISRRWKNVEHYCPNCTKYLGVYSRKSII